MGCAPSAITELWSGAINTWLQVCCMGTACGMVSCRDMVYGIWNGASDAAWRAAWYGTMACGMVWCTACVMEWDGARHAAWYGARHAAWYGARHAAWYGARHAAWYGAACKARHVFRHVIRHVFRHVFSHVPWLYPPTCDLPAVRAWLQTFSAIFRGMPTANALGVRRRHAPKSCQK